MIGLSPLSIWITCQYNRISAVSAFGSSRLYSVQLSPWARCVLLSQRACESQHHLWYYEPITLERFHIRPWTMWPFHTLPEIWDDGLLWWCVMRYTSYFIMADTTLNDSGGREMRLISGRFGKESKWKWAADEKRLWCDNKYSVTEFLCWWACKNYSSMWECTAIYSLHKDVIFLWST